MAERRPLVRDGATLSGVDVGEGPAVLFQHGLGGDERQVAEAFPDGAGFRRLTLECRGHGASGPGPLDRFSIAAFADDALAFLDRRGVARFVAGGISMGAAIALRLAVRMPERVRALVLARPAWLAERAPENLRVYAEVGRLFDGEPRASGRDAFLASDSGRRLAAEAPDNLASLAGFFAPDRPAWTGALLQAIAGDGPGVTEAEIRAIRMPTLVIGHGRDLAHPLAYAETLAAMIPGARLARITPKATDKAAYLREFRAALTEFLASLPPTPQGMSEPDQARHWSAHRGTAT
jgi:pimeloyl-ACP methyl ester carboxylesterase